MFVASSVLGTLWVLPAGTSVNPTAIVYEDPSLKLGVVAQSFNAYTLEAESHRSLVDGGIEATLVHKVRLCFKINKQRKASFELWLCIDL